MLPPDESSTMTARTGSPWNGRTILKVAAVVLVVAGAVAAVILLTRGGGPGLVAQASPSPSASPSGYVVGDRLVNDAWTVDWNATYDPASDVVPLLTATAPASFDDGLTDADLGERAPRDSPRFPPSYVATDAIWSHVGPGWGIAIFGTSNATYVHERAGFHDVPSEVFLVSPEGHYFFLWKAVAPTRYGGSYPIYRIDGVYPDLGWIRLSGSYVHAETETPGYDEVRDLRTGTILTQEWSGGEGDSRDGTDRQVIGPLADGSWFWADVTVDELSGNDPTATASIVDANGTSTPVALPDIYYYGATFWSADDAGETIMLSGGGEFTGPGTLYMYDVAEGTWTDATHLLVGPDRSCIFTRPNDASSFFAYCGIEDSMWDPTLIGFDGSMTAVTGEVAEGLRLHRPVDGHGFRANRRGTR